jgi:hypothetical protein
MVTRSYKDNGYTFGTISDKNADGVGPFDGFAYTTTATLTYATVGLINPYILPGGPSPTGACDKKGTCRNFYAENARKKADIAGFVTANEEHEGYGPAGNPGGGHAGLIGQAAQMDAGNINKLLEAQFNKDPTQLEKDANKAIQDAIDFTRAWQASPSVIWGPKTIYCGTRGPRNGSPGQRAWVGSTEPGCSAPAPGTPSAGRMHSTSSPSRATSRAGSTISSGGCGSWPRSGSGPPDATSSPAQRALRSVRAAT